MRLNSISIYRPSFTSIERSKRTPMTSRPDCFVKSEFDYDKETKIMYDKLQKSMGIVTPKDIVISANKIFRKTGVPLDDVYKTMGLLSQYSSYKSLSGINKELKKDGVQVVNDLSKYYGDESEIPVYLTNILDYLLTKNYNYKSNYGNIAQDKKALFVDSKLIETVQIDKCFYKGKKTDYYYIENFENGYNFLNQSKSFEDYTTEIIEKAKRLKSYTHKSFNYNVKFLLNGYVYSNTDALSVLDNIHIISKENICTPEKIADNLNPIIPSYKTFKKTLDNIAKTHAVSQIDGEKYVIESLSSMFEPITPKQLSNYLQELHTKIEKYLKSRNRDLNKVYYIVPSRNKSFALINYQYKNANKIDDLQTFVMTRNSIFDGGLKVDTFNKGTTFVVIDDYLLSGLSMLNEQFPYDILVERSSSFKRKDMEVIFAPVFATENGLKRIDKYMKMTHRDDKDCIIPARILPQVVVDDSKMPVVRSNTYLTSSVMPYMGPDSNAEEFVPLYQCFLCSPKAQKEPQDSFDAVSFG